MEIDELGTLDTYLEGSDQWRSGTTSLATSTLMPISTYLNISMTVYTFCGINTQTAEGSAMVAGVNNPPDTFRMVYKGDLYTTSHNASLFFIGK